MTAVATSARRQPQQAMTGGSLVESRTLLGELLDRVETAELEAHNLRRALEHSRDIGTAVGVLMALRKVTRDEAFELLRRTSQDHNRKVHALALDVISTGALPER
ncbi:MAG TPA: ANTAR domain-containing protein [Microbacterium sp.]|nr:ANTAR domain-containing protein [Microbacterium sp.]